MLKLLGVVMVRFKFRFIRLVVIKVFNLGLCMVYFW